MNVDCRKYFLFNRAVNRLLEILFEFYLPEFPGCPLLDSWKQFTGSSGFCEAKDGSSKDGSRTALEATTLAQCTSEEDTLLPWWVLPR